MQQTTLGLAYTENDVDCFQFTVPGAPQVKERPRLSRGRVITPQKTREYEAKVAACAVRQRPDDWLERPCSSYGIEMNIYRARRSGDLDNFIKSVCDGLNNIAYPDDSSVHEIHAYMATDKSRPRAEITIWKLNAN